jgi:hypothetical protein
MDRSVRELWLVAPHQPTTSLPIASTIPNALAIFS